MIWYSEPLERVAGELNVDIHMGLDDVTAAARLDEYGPNKLNEKPPRTFIQRFLDQMKDVMILILLIAALISLGISIYNVVTGEGHPEWAEPIVIVLIVLLNAILGVVQESKAEAALEALKNMSAPEARVLRGGVEKKVKSHDLVPGDIVEMEAGDLVPADCRLIYSASFQCDEASLTGESVPVQKIAEAAIPDIASLGDRVNMAYSGCAVSYGHARAVVVETGMATEMGKIATMLESEEGGSTPLQQKLAQLGKYLGFLALGICAIIFIVGLVKGLGLMEMFMTAVSLAVAAIPEGLPAIVTIVLAIGVQRLVVKNAIVRRLPAVEALGSASVICSDKTGTLTQNRMTLVKAFNGKSLIDLGDSVPNSALSLIRLGTLCTDGSVRVVGGVQQHMGDPTETAIIAAAMRYGMHKDDLVAEHPRMGEIPFDSDRKLMTTVNRIGDQNVVIVKGAPDILFDRCVWGGDETRQEAEQANAAMAHEALRVLAVGYKSVDDLPLEYHADELEDGLTFGGLLGMIDPPRAEVKVAIGECVTAGVRTVMITGDHVITASAIARELGIMGPGDEAITGAELARLSDDELFANIRKYRVYARVTPADKIRIVKAWQQAGEIVAMTGDGVNDAPALKAADIGCAMGITGTDVAKGAADMILTDDNFATIVTAVKEGRGIYDNIRKAVHFLLSCNLGEILTVFVCMLLFPEGAPLAAVQLLWVNLVTDSLPALALSMEPTEPDIMTRAPRAKKESIFAHGLGVTAVWQGVMTGVLTFLAYFLGTRVLFGTYTEETKLIGESMAFATLALSQLVHAFNVRSHHSVFRIGLHTNKYMIGAFFASLALMLVVLLAPFLQGIFDVVPMNGTAWLVVAALSLAPLAIVEGVKALQRVFKGE